MVSSVVQVGRLAGWWPSDFYQREDVSKLADANIFDRVARSADQQQQKALLDSMNRALSPTLESIASKRALEGLMRQLPRQFERSHNAALEGTIQQLSTHFEFISRAAKQQQKVLFDSMNRALSPALESIASKRVLEGLMQQLSTQTRVSLAKTLTEPNTKLMESLREHLLSIQRSLAIDFNSILPPEKILNDLSKSMNLLLDKDSFANLRRTLSELHSGPALAAFETIRKLRLDRIHPEFSEYITEAAGSAETIDAINKLGADYLSTHKDRLSRDQTSRLMLYLTILQLLVAFYQAVQCGKPVKIDPAQIEMLRPYPEVSITILQFFGTASIYYEVQRCTELKLKPGNRSITITRLKPGGKVRLISNNHKWIYIEYQERAESLPVYGWANKKYLKRLN